MEKWRMNPTCFEEIEIYLHLQIQSLDNRKQFNLVFNEAQFDLQFIAQSNPSGDIFNTAFGDKDI